MIIELIKEYNVKSANLEGSNNFVLSTLFPDSVITYVVYWAEEEYTLSVYDWQTARN